MKVKDSKYYAFKHHLKKNAACWRLYCLVSVWSCPFYTLTLTDWPSNYVMRWGGVGAQASASISIRSRNSSVAENLCQTSSRTETSPWLTPSSPPRINDADPAQSRSTEDGREHEAVTWFSLSEAGTSFGLSPWCRSGDSWNNRDDSTTDETSRSAQATEVLGLIQLIQAALQNGRSSSVI